MEGNVARGGATFAIRRGAPADAGALAMLAGRTFEETFAEANDPADMALYLSRTYGRAQQERELSIPEMTTLLAESGRELIGFAQLRLGGAPPCVQGPRPIELLRFYVDGPWQGSGVARALMDATVAEAMARGAATLWLGVWERNERAQGFYRKCGFVDVGSHPFVLGTDRQTDRIMSRPLP
jgi:ribosomal protein S18 acetylase RimI-like enzyme